MHLADDNVFHSVAQLPVTKLMSQNRQDLWVVTALLLILERVRHINCWLLYHPNWECLVPVYEFSPRSASMIPSRTLQWTLQVLLGTFVENCSLLIILFSKDFWCSLCCHDYCDYLPLHLPCIGVYLTLGLALASVAASPSSVCSGWGSPALLRGE